MVITLNTQLAEQIQEACGENVHACYQCRKCTAGCPLTDYMDMMPHHLVRAIQFGQKDAVLGCKTIWLCAACEACSTRCPQDIDLPRIVDVLRIMAKNEGVTPAVRPVPYFFTAALRGIKLFGRMYEPGLLGELYLRMAFSGDLDREQFIKKDIPVALRMLRAGKLNPFPPIGRGTRHRRKSREGEARYTAAYYPGCSLHSTAVEYDMSTRAVADVLGLELVEPSGWTCCGTTPAHSTDHLLSTVMPMKSLARVEKSGQSYVTVPCPSCFVRFRTALRDIAADQELREEVVRRTSYEPSPELTVDHLLTTITDQVGIDVVADAVARPLQGLKAVCYYGCVLTRPPELTGAKEYEYPMNMDHLVDALGAESVDWSYKTECCGVSLQMTQSSIAREMSRKVLDNAKQVGDEVIVVACPLCQANLDVRQRQIGEESGQTYDLPILYFTQLMGLAFGLKPSALGLDKHFVSAEPLLREKGLWEGA